MAEEDSISPDDEPISLIGDDEPISLVDSEDSSDFKPGGIKMIGAAAEEAHEEVFKRALNVNGSGATRCRLFHSKISVASLEFMQHQINEWLDNNEIEIKQVGHLVGTMEGKRPEPNLLVMVWY